MQLCSGGYDINPPIVVPALHYDTLLNPIHKNSIALTEYWELFYFGRLRISTLSKYVTVSSKSKFLCFPSHSTLIVINTLAFRIITTRTRVTPQYPSSQVCQLRWGNKKGHKCGLKIINLFRISRIFN